MIYNRHAYVTPTHFVVKLKDEPRIVAKVPIKSAFDLFPTMVSTCVLEKSKGESFCNLPFSKKELGKLKAYV